MPSSTRRRGQRKKSLIQVKANEFEIDDNDHETHPWKTFDFEYVQKSKRFSYLADPLLVRGYSIQTTLRDSFLSLFAWHNETINVWSHLIGSILFICLFASWYQMDSPSNWLTTQRGQEVFMEYAGKLSKEASLVQASLRQMVSQFEHDVEDKKESMLQWLLEEKLVFQSWLLEEKNTLTKALDQLKETEWLKRRVSLVAWIQSSIRNATSPLSLLLRERLLKDNPLLTPSDILSTLSASPPLVPLWPMLVFCFGSTMCLMCSAIYHLFVGHHCHTYNVLCRMDLAGISFMIWGSCVPLIYYVFFKLPQTIFVYLSALTLVSGLTLTFTLLPAHHMHRLKVPRVLAYLFAGLFSVAPLLHAICKWGVNSPEVQRYTNEGMILVVGLLYVFGAIIYISRFPEKYFRGWFDFVLASHQIWHLSVFSAAVVHYQGLVKLYLWRVEQEDGQLL